MMKWVCTVCGHQHRGVDAPDNCPKCGSEKEEFDYFAHWVLGMDFDYEVRQKLRVI